MSLESPADLSEKISIEFCLAAPCDPIVHITIENHDGLSQLFDGFYTLYANPPLKGVGSISCYREVHNGVSTVNKENKKLHLLIFGETQRTILMGNYHQQGLNLLHTMDSSNALLVKVE